MNLLTPENVPALFIVGNKTTNGGIESRYYSLRNCEAVRIEVLITNAVSHATVVNIWQDKANGTGSGDEKALELPVPIWHDAGSIGANINFPTRQTDGVSFTIGTTTAPHTIVFYVRASKLDCENGYSHIGVTIDDSLQATNFASVLLSFENQFKGSENEGTYL